MFHNALVLSLPPNPHAGAPSLVGYPHLLVEYIRSCSPYLNPVSSVLFWLKGLKLFHLSVGRPCCVVRFDLHWCSIFGICFSGFLSISLVACRYCVTSLNPCSSVICAVRSCSVILYPATAVTKTMSAVSIGEDHHSDQCNRTGLPVTVQNFKALLLATLLRSFWTFLHLYSMLFHSWCTGLPSIVLEGFWVWYDVSNLTFSVEQDLGRNYIYHLTAVISSNQDTIYDNPLFFFYILSPSLFGWRLHSVYSCGLYTNGSWC
jgi:hypothetical protein